MPPVDGKVGPGQMLLGARLSLDSVARALLIRLNKAAFARGLEHRGSVAAQLCTRALEQPHARVHVRLRLVEGRNDGPLLVQRRYDEWKS